MYVRAIVISSYVHDGFVCPDGYLPDVSKARKVRIAPVKIAVRLAPRHSDSKQRKHNNSERAIARRANKLETIDNGRIGTVAQSEFLWPGVRSILKCPRNKHAPENTRIMYVTHVRERKAKKQGRV